MNKVWLAENDDDSYTAIIVAKDAAEAKRLLNKYYGTSSGDTFCDRFDIVELDLDDPRVALTDGW